MVPPNKVRITCHPEGGAGVRKGAKDLRAACGSAPEFVRRSFAPTRAPTLSLPRNTQCLCRGSAQSISQWPNDAGGVNDGSRWWSAKRETTGASLQGNRPRRGSQRRHDLSESVCDPCRGRNLANSDPVAARLERLPPATLSDVSGVGAAPSSTALCSLVSALTATA